MINTLDVPNAVDKGALDSKKWKAMLLGVVCVMLVYASSLVMLTVLGGSIADKIVSLAKHSRSLSFGMSISMSKWTILDKKKKKGNTGFLAPRVT